MLTLTPRTRRWPAPFPSPTGRGWREGAGALSLLLLVVLLGCQSVHTPDWVRQRPPSAEEPFVVLWLKNNYFHPIGRLFSLDRHVAHLAGETGEADHLLPAGSVADSSFYTNRDLTRLSPQDIFRGATTDPPPTPPFTITKVKEGGAAQGFFGKDSLGARFLFKLDLPDYPELTTGAEVVGSRLIWALGYNVPQMYIVTIQGTGDPRFDGRRALASRFLSGDIIGPFKFNGVRDRREMRALQLAQGWLNNVDCTDFNTLITWEPGASPSPSVPPPASMDKGPSQGDVGVGLQTHPPTPQGERRDRAGAHPVGALSAKSGPAEPPSPTRPSSPPSSASPRLRVETSSGETVAGVARYWILDFSSALGATDHGPKEPKQGWEHTWDVGQQVTDLFTLRLPPRPYDEKAKPFSPAVGLFDDNYDPRRWKPLMPNMAFLDMTEADARWLAAKIAAFTPEQLRAAIAAGEYSRQRDRDYLLQMLLRRQAIITRTFPPTPPASRVPVPPATATGQSL